MDRKENTILVLPENSDERMHWNHCVVVEVKKKKK